MKKITSLFLALLLLLSLAGCNTPRQTVTAPPTQFPALDAVAQILVPELVGRSIDSLTSSENYTVVSRDAVPSSEPAGTILAQEPEKGSFADIGCTIYVTVSLGDGTTLPEQTDPPEQMSTVSPYQQAPTVPDSPTEPPYTAPPQTEPPQTEPPQTEPPQTDPPQTNPPEPTLDKDGSYTTKDDVALYIHLYGKLPNNFITKRQADNQYGTTNVSKYGKCIGGDRFYNKEGLLPSGYTYYECDIGTLYSSSRGAKRLVFTYSGIIYYTSDHYNSFTRLY